MAISQVATGVTILNTLNGYNGLSFTEWGTSAVSAIKQGSVIEVASAWFLAASDTAINASSLTVVATGSSFYVTVVPSGTAGSQILTPFATTTAPVWTVKQGWYASAASVTRYVGGMTKLGTSSYGLKWLAHGQEADLNNAAARLTKIMEIGDWNMPTTTTVTIVHGLTIGKIRRVDAIIRQDDDSNLYNLGHIEHTGTDFGIGGHVHVQAANILLERQGDVTASSILGMFISSSFDSTSFNRGWVIIEYEP